MIPIDIQVSRSKVKVKGQAYSTYVWEGGALVFYKYLYLCLFCRLFDSQNNNRGGYNVGSLYYYAGSQVQVEWLVAFCQKH